MRTIIIGLTLGVLFCYSGFVYSQKPDREFPKFITFERTIGDNNVPDEYLIGENRYNRGSLYYTLNMDVDSNDNVFIFNEFKIKVYDKEGNAKMIFGGRGQGPGEFQGNYNSGLPTVGPSGYITMFNESGDRFYNLYDSYGKFIKIINRREYVSGQQFNCKTIAISEFENVYESFKVIKKDELRITTFSLIHSNNDEKSIIASYEVPTGLTVERSLTFIPNNGDLFWDIIPGGKVCWTHSRYDEIYSDEGSYYIFHIYNLTNGKKSDYKLQFNPVLFEDYKGRIGQDFVVTGGNFEKIKNKRDEYLKRRDYKYCEAVEKVFFDGFLAYVFTNTTREKEKNEFEYKVDIINLDTGKNINSVYMPLLDEYKLIKNGYLYLIGRNSEGFICIKKYRIDPAVYRK